MGLEDEGDEAARRYNPTPSAVWRLVRARGREPARSLGTNDIHLAIHLARDILAEFDAATAAARHRTLQEVLDLLADWRDSELMACRASANRAASRSAKAKGLWRSALARPPHEPRSGHPDTSWHR